MMKRTNEREGYSNSPEPEGNQKRRRIQFEPVRMPAVSNVNDIKARCLIYQASKLKQQLVYKNNRIAELEKENVTARRRQQTDERNFLKVYNLFAELEKYICIQTKNEFGEYEGYADAPSGTDVQSMSSEGFMKFVDESKLNLRKAFLSYSKARHDRAKEMTELISKLKNIIDEPDFKCDDVMRELVNNTEKIVTQNEKLQNEVTKVQTESFNSDRKRRQLLDKHTVLENRVQELEHQLEDSRFEVDKQMRLASKYEAKLLDAVDNEKSGGSRESAGTSDGADKKMNSPSSSPKENVSKEIESLRAERDDLNVIAERRLREIEEINKTLFAANQKIALLETDKTEGITAKAIQESEEYKVLKQYYSLVVKEYDRVCKEMEEVTIERDRLRMASDTLSMQMSEEHAKTMKEISHQSEIHNSFFKVVHESDVLRFDFETTKDEYNKTVKQSEWEEMKSTANSLRALNATYKSESVRFKEKMKQSYKEIHNLKSELKNLKEHQEKFILVPLVDDSSLSQEDVSNIRQEYDSMRKELRRLGALEKVEKQKQVEDFQKEVNRLIADKVSELETLRKANEALTNDEQAISDELEAIAAAVEEEQERNSQLVMEKRDLENRNLKMMNERMVHNQVIVKLQDKVEVLEKKAETDAQILKMQEFSKKSTDDANAKLLQSLDFKSGEISKIVKQLEHHRRQLKDVGKTRDEKQIELERCKQVYENVKKLYLDKAAEVDKIKNGENRLREEMDMIRAKYDRVKRNESALTSKTGDQVLEEANRQMKETLTCPSCKTRPKDCIMLKCYHLFCETCIKTMYDTRQRKCPKCNSNFGANDFHRVFI